jgi:membrane protease YdiL (CAAX protease family)
MKKLKNLTDKPFFYTLITGVVLPVLTMLIGGILVGIVLSFLDNTSYMNEMNAVVLIVFSILVALWVKKSLGDGFCYGIRREGLGLALLLALPMLAHSLLYIAQGVFSEVQSGLSFLDFLLPTVTGIQPGVLEELFYRGMVFGGLMHFRAGKKNRVLVAVLASTLSFTLIHMVNMLSGQSFIGTVNQLLFAFAVGGVLCASYLRTRNIWAAIFYHSLHDSFAFFLIRTTGASSDGAPSVAQIIINALSIAYACYIIFTTKQETIDALWGAAPEEAAVEEIGEI